MPEGRQSPPPETQTGAQKDAPSNAKGVSQGGNNQQDSKSDLEVRKFYPYSLRKQ